MTRLGSTRASRWIALGVLCVGMLMIVLDTTVVNVALPLIHVRGDDACSRLLSRFGTQLSVRASIAREMPTSDAVGVALH